MYNYIAALKIETYIAKQKIFLYISSNMDLHILLYKFVKI